MIVRFMQTLTHHKFFCIRKIKTIWEICFVFVWSAFLSAVPWSVPTHSLLGGWREKTSLFQIRIIYWFLKLPIQEWILGDVPIETRSTVANDAFRIQSSISYFTYLCK